MLEIILLFQFYHLIAFHCLGGPGFSTHTVNHNAWKFYLNCYLRINQHNGNCILFLGRCWMTSGKIQLQH